jgi:choline transporter-like protein 2/4/5
MGGGGSKVGTELDDDDDLPKETEADKQDPDNKCPVVEPDFGGPCKKRRCTDCLCLLLLGTCWFVMTYIGLACIPGAGIDNAVCDEETKGNPYRLINGMDYKGQICGINKDVKSKPKLYYLQSGQGVCVKKCPKSTDVESFICTYNAQDDLDAITDDVAYVAEGYDQVGKDKCSPVYATTDVINYCLSTDAIDLGAELAASALVDDGTTNTTLGYNDSPKEWYEKAYGDLFTAKDYIFGFGIGGAILVGFVYTFFLRIPGVLSLIIWGLLFAIAFFLALGGLLCYNTSKRWADDEERTKTQADGMLYMAYGLGALCALWLALLCCIRKRIMLAIGIVKEAARSIAAMPIIVVFPIVQITALVIFVLPWFIYCLYLASAGEMKVRDGGAAGDYREFVYTKNQYYAGWYMLFIYYWTSEFIVAIGQLVVAMAVSTWYFTRDKSSIGNTTVISSMRRSFRYHAGTAAFGSLIIAIIKTIRAIVAYIQKKAKKTKTCKVLVQVVLCVIQCCLWCVEKCMKFINKNAYIQTAIFGHSFCKAARCAFFLILRNIVRIAALGLVSGFVLLLGKVIITTGATILCYIALDASGFADDELNYLWLPLVFTAFIAFYVAQMFNEVWGMAMSTILQCFVADEEIYKKDSDAMFAGDSLKSCVSSSNKGKYKDKGKVAPGTAAQESSGDAII